MTVFVGRGGINVGILVGTGTLIGDGSTVIVLPGSVTIGSDGMVTLIGGIVATIGGRVTWTSSGPDALEDIEVPKEKVNDTIAVASPVHINVFLISNPSLCQSYTGRVPVARWTIHVHHPCTKELHVQLLPQKGVETAIYCRFPSYKYYISNCVD